MLYALNRFEHVTEQKRRDRAKLWMKSRLPQNSHVNLPSPCGGDTLTGGNGGDANGSAQSKPQTKLHCTAVRIMAVYFRRLVYQILYQLQLVRSRAGDDYNQIVNFSKSNDFR